MEKICINAMGMISSIFLRFNEKAQKGKKQKSNSAYCALALVGCLF